MSMSDSAVMALIAVIVHLELELDWTSPLESKSNSPILGIGQCPIPTLSDSDLFIEEFLENIPDDSDLSDNEH
ncbi:hypothetical protein RhiirA4_453542 [Rhizophagus irregularis]|uniref:Uncharacterized protein n=1 Tax=Rhizophagus irregularis TaxID=588596 RepID=A0A2I1G0R2_9GLOM|nr:hypothetical protein RhiirA4_453542 [Rhizophagus irregularis]